MSASVYSPLNGRNLVTDSFPGTTGAATAVFHGTIGCVNSSGFAQDYTSTACPAVLGVVTLVDNKAGSTGDVITTQGSINQGIHLVDLVTEGRIDSIPFNSDISADDVGRNVYAIDNYTLTCNPGADDNMSRVGILTKFYTTKKGEVKLEGYPIAGLYEKAWELTTSSSSIFMAIPNPLGVDCVLKDFECCITTAASSAHAVAAGIAATSTTPASDVCITATAGMSFGSTGVYGTAKTTNFAGNIYWGATKFLTLSSSSVIGTGSANGTLVGYLRYTYKKVFQ